MTNLVITKTSTYGCHNNKDVKPRAVGKRSEVQTLLASRN